MGLKPYYEHGGITIYHGDCREVLPTLRADAVITDPPYGTKVTTWDESIDQEMFSACMDATRGYATFFYSNTRLWHILACLKATGADTWTAVWHKSNAMGFERHFAPQWVPIVIAYRRGNGKPKFWGQDHHHCAIVPHRDMAHPTPKPVGVTRWLVEHASEAGQVVLDPFAGSGTTLLAAQQSGRRAIGIEIEERYCEIAAKRLAQDVLPLEAAV